MRLTNLVEVRWALTALCAALLVAVTGCGGGPPRMAASAMPAVAPGGGGAPAPMSVPVSAQSYGAEADVASEAPSDESDRTVAKANPPPPPPPAAPQPLPGQAPKPNPVAQDAPHVLSMLIYTATLNLAVFQVEAQMNQVEAIAHDIGGYLSLRNDTQITIRVPREKFQDALARVEKLGDVLHRAVTAEDVTDQFLDLEVRLKNARAVRDQLQALLAKATVKDALEIEKELGRVTESIEQMEGKLKLLRDKIAFSTITVNFQPVDTQPVRDATTLPFPWLQQLGLSSLLSVH